MALGVGDAVNRLGIAVTAAGSWRSTGRVRSVFRLGCTRFGSPGIFEMFTTRRFASGGREGARLCEMTLRRI